MKSLTIALIAAGIASCAAPWFQEGGKVRGIDKGIKNRWADIVVNMVEIHDVAPLGNGSYAIDFSFQIAARKKTYDKKKYHGIISAPFTVQALVQLEGTEPPVTETTFDENGEEVTTLVSDTVLVPLSFDRVSALMFPATGPPPQANPGAPQVLPTQPVPYNPSPPGELLKVKPPMWPGDKKQFRRVGFLSGFVPRGARVELVIRADIYNDIHPEHDGDDVTDSEYRAPDFDSVHRTNNEVKKAFQLP